MAPWPLSRRCTCSVRASGSNGSSPEYSWSFDDKKPVRASKAQRQILEIPVDQIRRPLARTRSNNQAKVKALMESIERIGLQEPIDVLEVEGQYYGFSGCHRYEAHQRLGKPTILCRVRKANKATLKMHMM
ncbi:hypothetical protein WJX72_008688 [[Myrmecia] bisecta]|uniref:sulfiredoxin n=1 Tax=[Myrmecia] bisecta TaxID=41462 RepID=A0AAW1R809_9CHLO